MLTFAFAIHNLNLKSQRFVFQQAGGPGAGLERLTKQDSEVAQEAKSTIDAKVAERVAKLNEQNDKLPAGEDKNNLAGDERKEAENVAAYYIKATIERSDALDAGKDVDELLRLADDLGVHSSVRTEIGGHVINKMAAFTESQLDDDLALKNFEGKVDSELKNELKKLRGEVATIKTNGAVDITDIGQQIKSVSKSIDELHATYTIKLDDALGRATFRNTVRSYRKIFSDEVQSHRIKSDKVGEMTIRANDIETLPEPPEGSTSDQWNQYLSRLQEMAKEAGIRLEEFNRYDQAKSNIDLAFTAVPEEWAAGMTLLLAAKKIGVYEIAPKTPESLKLAKMVDSIARLARLAEDLETLHGKDGDDRAEYSKIGNEALACRNEIMSIRLDSKDETWVKNLSVSEVLDNAELNPETYASTNEFERAYRAAWEKNIKEPSFGGNSSEAAAIRGLIVTRYENILAKIKDKEAGPQPEGAAVAQVEATKPTEAPKPSNEVAGGAQVAGGAPTDTTLAAKEAQPAPPEQAAQNLQSIHDKIAEKTQSYRDTFNNLVTEGWGNAWSMKDKRANYNYEDRLQVPSLAEIKGQLDANRTPDQIITAKIEDIKKVAQSLNSLVDRAKDEEESVEGSVAQKPQNKNEAKDAILARAKLQGTDTEKLKTAQQIAAEEIALSKDGFFDQYFRRNLPEDEYGKLPRRTDGRLDLTYTEAQETYNSIKEDKEVDKKFVTELEKAAQAIDTSTLTAEKALAAAKKQEAAKKALQAIKSGQPINKVYLAWQNGLKDGKFETASDASHTAPVADADPDF